MGTKKAVLLMAGYRNRLVYLYHEVGPEEVYKVCSSRMDDLEYIVNGYRSWLEAHKELLDEMI